MNCETHLDYSMFITFSITCQTVVSDLVIWCSSPGITPPKEEREEVAVDPPYVREWQLDDVI